MWNVSYHTFDTIPLLVRSEALWFPDAQLKHNLHLANICLRSDVDVTFGQLSALCLLSSQ